MTNFNETTSIEILSDDELSLVGGGCSGRWQSYKSYASYQTSAAAPSSAGNNVVVAQANVIINGSSIDDSVFLQNVQLRDNAQLIISN